MEQDSSITVRLANEGEKLWCGPTPPHNTINAQEIVFAVSWNGGICVCVRGGGVGVVFLSEMPIPSSYNFEIAHSTLITTTWHDVLFNKLWLIHGCC